MNSTDRILSSLQFIGSLGKLRKILSDSLPCCIMADYWKSHAKKFCDFCKCWIADNKPSIGFHEAGKRHKENVSKRLSEISKNSAKSYKEGLQIDHDMKKMEEEAMKAYMKDLNENPDYTSKKILEEADKRKRELEEAVRQKKEEKDAEHTIDVEEKPAEKVVASKLWYEAKSDEGYTYYWNVNTSESIWEPPEEGFVSLEEQEKEAKLKEEEKKRKKEEKAKRKEEMKIAKESSNKKRKKQEDVGKDEELSVCVGPAPKPDPYGPWTRVEPVVEEPIDWQLPVQNKYVAIKVPVDAPPEIKFKEKTVSSIEEDTTPLCSVKKEIENSSTVFKKRKFNKGNARQKLDTD